eukprot:sb/3477095/
MSKLPFQHQFLLEATVENLRKPEDYQDVQMFFNENDPGAGMQSTTKTQTYTCFLGPHEGEWGRQKERQKVIEGERKNGRDRRERKRVRKSEERGSLGHKYMNRILMNIIFA